MALLRRHGTFSKLRRDESGVVDETPLTAAWREPASLATHARDLGHTYRLEASQSAARWRLGAFHLGVLGR